MYKMVVFDIDGTLIPYQQNSLSNEIKNMFKRLKDNGKIVTLATGRDFVSIGDIHLDENVDYFIGANGSFIYDLKNKTYLFNSVISFDEFEKFYNDVLISNQNYINNVILSDDENVYVWNKKQLDGHWFWEPFNNKFKPFEDAKKLIKHDKFHLITINCTKGHPLIENSKEYFEKTNSLLYVQAWWPNGFFVANKNVSKFTSIEKLCKYLNISVENVIAFGDGENDISMLKNVGLGVAMGNANEFVKSVAKDTTTTVNEFGTIQFLEKNGII